MAQKKYRCKDCGNEVMVEERAAAPDCCGGTMVQVPLEPCTHAQAMEAARPGLADDACDDGVK